MCDLRLSSVIYSSLFPLFQLIGLIIILCALSGMALLSLLRRIKCCKHNHCCSCCSCYCCDEKNKFYKWVLKEEETVLKDVLKAGAKETLTEEIRRKINDGNWEECFDAADDLIENDAALRCLETAAEQVNSHICCSMLSFMSDPLTFISQRFMSVLY